MGGTIGPEPEYYIAKYVKCDFEYCQNGFIPERSFRERMVGGYPCHECNGKGYRKVMVKESKR